MKIVNRNSILIMMSILTISCRKPLEIDIPQTKPQLAIFSQIIPNQIVAITVTRSFTALTDIVSSTSPDNSLKGVLVSRALVTISHNQITDTLKKLTDGLYGALNISLLVGENYELNVWDSTSGEHINSFAKVLPIVEDSLKINVTRNVSDTSYSINIKMKDNPALDEYYYFNVSNLGKNDLLNQASTFFSTVNSNRNFILTTDREAINGFVQKEYLSGSNTENLLTSTNKDSVSIVVASISKDYYDFLNAYQKGNSFFAQIFGEPINYPSNINNGVGIFTAHLPKFYFIDLKDY
jgi:hypothetical protein